MAQQYYSGPRRVGFFQSNSKAIEKDLEIERQKEEREHARSLEILNKQIEANERLLKAKLSAADAAAVYDDKAQLEKEKAMIMLRKEMTDKAVAEAKAQQREGLKAVSAAELSKPKGGFRLPQAAIGPVSEARADYLMKAAEAGPLAKPIAAGVNVEAGTTAAKNALDAEAAKGAFDAANPGLSNPAVATALGIIGRGTGVKSPMEQEMDKEKLEQTRVRTELLRQKALEESQGSLADMFSSPASSPQPTISPKPTAADKFNQFYKAPKGSEKTQEDGSEMIRPEEIDFSAPVVPTGMSFQQEPLTIGEPAKDDRQELLMEIIRRGLNFGKTY